MGLLLGRFRAKHQSIEVDGSCAQGKANEKLKVRICDDVLIGVLSFGRRRHFAMLEPHGTRFHYFIDRYWPEAPLLILDMDCWKYEKNDDKIYGVSIARPLQPLLDHQMFSLNHVFSSVPRFLRFGRVKINLTCWIELPISMAERREIYMPLFQQLAPAFHGCSLRFHSNIRESMCEEYVRIGDFGFPNHRAQLEYIRERLIPQLFDHCSSYSFGTEIGAFNRFVDGYPDIAGLLAIDVIKRCNRVDINAFCGKYSNKCPCCAPGHSNSISTTVDPFCLPPLLPINEISAWLHKPSKKDEERFLSIDMSPMENIHGLIELLKTQLQEATSPTGHAFTLKLITHSVEIAEETFKNTRTNEELSISWQFDDYYGDEGMQIVTIKQAPCEEPPKKKHKLSK